MRRALYGAALLLLLAPLLAFGCSGQQTPPAHSTELWRPSVAEPTDDLEREVLRLMPSVADGGGAITVLGTQVAVGRSYPAASGRRCRTVTISAMEAETRSRLVCLWGDEWRFAPEVFPTSLAAEGHK